MLLLLLEVKHEATSLYGTMSELLVSVIAPVHHIDGCGC